MTEFSSVFIFNKIICFIDIITWDSFAFVFTPLRRPFLILFRRPTCICLPNRTLHSAFAPAILRYAYLRRDPRCCLYVCVCSITCFFSLKRQLVNITFSYLCYCLTDPATHISDGWDFFPSSLQGVDTDANTFYRGFINSLSFMYVRVEFCKWF